MDINIETACRICLLDGAEKNIFKTEKQSKSKKVSFGEMMMFCFSLQIDKDNALVTKICNKCCSKLKSAYKLKLQAIKTNNILSRLQDVKPSAEEKEHKIELFTPPPDIKNELTDLRDEPEIDVKGDSEFNLKTEITLEVKDVEIKNETMEDDIKVDGVENEFTDIPVDDVIVHSSDESVWSESNLEPLKVLNKKKSLKSSENNSQKTTIKKKRGRRRKLSADSPTELKPYVICHHCGKQVKDLKNHMKSHDENRKRLQCSDCDKSFITYGARRRHKAVHHLGILYFCKECNKHYKNGGEHMRLRHSDRPKPFHCFICPQAFFTKSSLAQHMTVHTKVKPHDCPVCGKSFRLKATMMYHKRSIHDGEKSHICQYCSKAFFSPHHLSVHVRSHTREKIYRCQHCNKLFATRSSVKNHERRHEGIKNFSCQFCEMTFYDNGSLRAHTISHTKEKKHECKYCGVKFGRSDHRNRHQRTAHEKEPLVRLPS